jgi:hypothetical protein
MTTQPIIETFHRNDARMLDIAEGVLVALRRYTPVEAFAEILDTARAHGVPALGLARALVELAVGGSETQPDRTAAVAHLGWGHLFADLPAPV